MKNNNELEEFKKRAIFYSFMMCIIFVIYLVLSSINATNAQDRMETYITEEWQKITSNEDGETIDENHFVIKDAKETNIFYIENLNDSYYPKYRLWIKSGDTISKSEYSHSLVTLHETNCLNSYFQNKIVYEKNEYGISQTEQIDLYLTKSELARIIGIQEGE